MGSCAIHMHCGYHSTLPSSLLALWEDEVGPENVSVLATMFMLQAVDSTAGGRKSAMIVLGSWMYKECCKEAKDVC